MVKALKQETKSQLALGLGKHGEQSCRPDRVAAGTDWLTAPGPAAHLAAPRLRGAEPTSIPRPKCQLRCHRYFSECFCMTADEGSWPQACSVTPAQGRCWTQLETDPSSSEVPRGHRTGTNTANALTLLWNEHCPPSNKQLGTLTYFTNVPVFLEFLTVSP